MSRPSEALRKVGLGISIAIGSERLTNACCKASYSCSYDDAYELFLRSYFRSVVIFVVLHNV